MPDRHPTMMEPPVEDLLDRVDSKFTLVSLAAMRGRQINSYFNQLGEGLGTIVPPQVTSVSRKPLSISLEEIAAGKITYTRPTGRPEPEGAEQPPTRSSRRRRPSNSHARLRPCAGRRIVLGVCGGIAAYKAVEVCRRLVDAGAFVSPVLTRGATRFVGPVTFSALASEPVRTSLWDEPEPIPHTRLGQSADLIVVAPATARLIGSYAAGISSDLLTATLLATRAPVLLCPAMHTEMWEHPAVVDNIARAAPARRPRGRARVRAAGRRRRRRGPPGRARRHRGRPRPSGAAPATATATWAGVPGRA